MARSIAFLFTHLVKSKSAGCSFLISDIGQRKFYLSLRKTENRLMIFIKLSEKQPETENRGLSLINFSGQKTTMAAWQVSDSCITQDVPFLEYRLWLSRKSCWIWNDTNIDFPSMKSQNETGQTNFEPSQLCFLVPSLRKWVKRIESHRHHELIEGLTVSCFMSDESKTGSNFGSYGACHPILMVNWSSTNLCSTRFVRRSVFM